MNKNGILLDVVMMTLLGVAIASVVGVWSYNYQSMLSEVMECMPDGTRQSYDLCYEELYGERG
jgi:hypothetical protein